MGALYLCLPSAGVIGTDHEAWLPSANREFAITEAIFLNDVRVVDSGSVFDPCKWRSVWAQKAVAAVLVKEGQNYKTILKGVINLLRIKDNSEVEGLRKDI